MEFYLGILLGLIALCAIVWAFVRSRVGDEPHCRRCGFSLAGLTEPEVCPECGRSLARRRAIVVGERRSRKRLVVVFLVLGGLSSVLVWLDGANRRGFIPVNEYKPAWLLLSEAYLLGDDRASAATEELYSRINSSRLGREWSDRLVNVALDRHRQTWRVFPEAQWKSIDTALFSMRLDAERIHRLLNDLVIETAVAGQIRDVKHLEPGVSDTVTIGFKLRGGEHAQRVFMSLFYNGESSMRLQDVGDITAHDYKRTGTRRFSLSRFGRTRKPYVFDIESDICIDVDVVAPWESGRYEGAVDLLADSVYLRARMNRLGGSSVDPELSPVAILSVPVTVEVKSHDFDSVEFDQTGGDPSNPLEFDVIRYGWETALQTPTSLVFVLRISDTAPLDPEMIGLGGFLVARQGDVEVRKLIAHGRLRTSITGNLPAWKFKAGEVHLTYEHNTNVAHEFMPPGGLLLEGPIDLGTITIPERIEETR